MGRRRNVEIHLKPEQVERLQAVVKARTSAQAVVRRAQILLLRDQGKTDTSIAAELKITRVTISNCVGKFLAMGLEAALGELARPGRPKVVDDEAKAWVVDIACTRPCDHPGYSQESWSIALLADYVRRNCVDAGHPALSKAGKSLVHSILNEGPFSIKPHKVRYYLDKRDPESKDKMMDVLLLYKEVNMRIEQGECSPSKGCVTISYDEKPGMQAIAGTAADLRPTRGHGFTARDSEYRRPGTVSLLAGLNLVDGEVIPLIRDSHVGKDFIDWLRLVDKKYGDAEKIKILLDNHSVHTSKETRAYLATVPERFEFVFTPKHGSWLNLVESFFGKLARGFLRNMRVESKQELVDRLYQYIATINEEPVVYHWKYKMDELNDMLAPAETQV